MDATGDVTGPVAKFVTTFGNAFVECDSFEDAAAIDAAEAILADAPHVMLPASSLEQLATVLERYELPDAARQMTALSREIQRRRPMPGGGWHRLR